MNYTVSEVATKLNTNKTTVYELLNGGLLKGFKLTNKPQAQWRVTEESLTEFINRDSE